MQTSSEELDDQAAIDAAPTPEIYPGLLGADRLDSDAVKVLKRLTRNGYIAYLVGGGVRDLLLNRQPKDFDIATSARPNEVRRLFRNCRVIGRRFRLAHILFSGGKIIEVATFRREPAGREGRDVEVESGNGDGREHSEDTDILIRQDNTFGVPHEDAIRRDFTINGLFYDLERQEVIDYVGGVRDLRAGVVSTIGRPDVRFREDPVRMLRAIKFSARLDMGISPDVYDAMVDQRGELARSASPRVIEEVLRLLRGGAAHRSIYVMWDVGVLATVLPELTAHLEDQAQDAELLWGRLAAIDSMLVEARLPSDTVLLAALLYGPLEEAMVGVRDPSGAFDDFFEQINERLSVPRRSRDRMRLIFAAQRRFDRNQHSRLRSREYFADAAALFEMRCLSRGHPLPEWLSEALPPAAPPRSASRRRRRTPVKRR